MKKILAGIGIIIALTVFALFFARNASAPSLQNLLTTSNQGSGKTGFNKELNSINESGSIWWIVNKLRPVTPIDYAPDDLVIPRIPLRVSGGDSEMRLRKDAAEALEAMAAAGIKDAVNMRLTSGYRSYQLQVSVYNGYVQQFGQAGADKQSARPGVSEHQTGLAADLEPVTGKCRLEVCFADLPEGKWLNTNAHLYGFIIRYPEGKTDVTGYQYEPWHLRYVGKELAAEMHKQNILTLEEFFNIVPDRQPY